MKQWILKIQKLTRGIAVITLKGYRALVSPLLGNHCRFYPSCSCYAQEAIERHGLLKGGYLTMNRLLKCHPYHPGGVDPVPEKPSHILK